MHEIEIAPRSSFSLEHTVGAFARFPDECVDVVVPGGFRRLFDINGHLVLAEARQEGAPALTAPVTLRVLNPRDVPDDAGRDALNALRRMLSLDEPVDRVGRLLCSDGRLVGLEPALRGLRRTLDPTPFEGLVSSILAQLISIAGAAVVRARLVQRFGRSLDYDGRTYWTFPAPEPVSGSSIDELCNLKMTSGKARSILAVAEAAVNGDLSYDDLDRRNDADLMRYLIDLPGIGPWTAEWFLVNVMGRMAVVPVGDLGIRRSTGTWFLNGEMPSQAEVREIYEPFGDQRAYVAYYVLSAERHGIRPSTGSE